MVHACFNLCCQLPIWTNNNIVPSYLLRCHVDGRRPRHSCGAQSFNHICQVVPVCTPTCWPVTIPNGSWIGSAVFALLMLHSPNTLHCAIAFPNKICPFTWVIYTPSIIHGSLSPLDQLWPPTCQPIFQNSWSLPIWIDRLRETTWNSTGKNRPLSHQIRHGTARHSMLYNAAHRHMACRIWCVSGDAWHWNVPFHDVPCQIRCTRTLTHYRFAW